uniref:ParE-like toxin of type II toxin-antitoxin system n=1 Tax=Candidatus Kentrum sp. TC TaxID=2126339 RepID=A0A450Z5A6_9GAMM|nr:MAG: ParE-like toxin of type II toxin-antitoxin system [Candidatus Kentron sp. TC]
MKVSATGRFNRIAKKLPPNIKTALDLAIRTIMTKPQAGRMKTGDLAGIRVHKFKVKSQLYLLSYIVDADNGRITLLYFGTHEK